MGVHTRTVYFKSFHVSDILLLYLLLVITRILLHFNTLLILTPLKKIFILIFNDNGELFNWGRY